MYIHLNKFNALFSQLINQKLVFLDFVKAIFLLITLLNSWETLSIALNNFSSFGCFNNTNVEGILYIEEVNRMSTEKGKGEALIMHGR